MKFYVREFGFCSGGGGGAALNLFFLAIRAGRGKRRNVGMHIGLFKSYKFTLYVCFTIEIILDTASTIV
jgi:hypothetical protein